MGRVPEPEPSGPYPEETTLPTQRPPAALLLPIALAFAAGCASRGPAGPAAPAPPTSAAPAPAAASAPAPQAGALFDPANLDRSASPCVDFYRYANGGWQAKHPRPAAYPEWGRFAELEERNGQQLRSLLETAARGNAAPGSVDRKIGDFYATCMDEAAIDKQGLDPLRLELGRINAIADLPALVEEVARLHGEGVTALFEVGPSQDLKNSSEMILDVLQGGLGLPDRDYYLKDDLATKKIRDEYGKHVARMLELSGEHPHRAAEETAEILALETRLAKVSKTRAERRDVPGNYHRMTLAQMDALTPHLSWERYVQAIGAPAIAGANVRVPAFLQTLDAELAARPIPEWRAYLRWHLLDAMAPSLSTPFVDEDFHFRKTVLQGVAENLPRWQRCVQSTDSHLGEALGQAYVEKYFSPAAKQRALEMIDNLTAALRDNLSTLPWMGEATRAEAQKKLAAFARKIGYPDRWIDYSPLEIGRGSHLENSRAATRFEFRRQIGRIGQPVDHGLWEISPPTVNAYYQPSMNEVVFPAGILQPPFFDPAADDAWNYGAIGSAIGHEMTHGFDDQGSQFDAQGNLRNWWSPADLASFKSRAECVARHYSGFSVEGTALNGKLVEGESIADIGGVKLAYAAYQKSLAGKPRQTLSGFTPEQRFFLAFAEIWAANAAPESERLQLATDPHPLPRFRVDGVVADLPEFARAFSCKPGDPLARPEGERCQVW
jgi:predicted metalloendopeptidase